MLHFLNQKMALYKLELKRKLTYDMKIFFAKERIKSSFCRQGVSSHSVGSLEPLVNEVLSELGIPIFKLSGCIKIVDTVADTLELEEDYSLYGCIKPGLIRPIMFFLKEDYEKLKSDGLWRP